MGKIRTSLALLVPTFALLTPPGDPFPAPFTGGQDAPLPCRNSCIRGFGTGLSPVGLSVPRHHRPVSYYALFQGWLLLSQPPGCLCTATALPTQSGFGDLSRRSGLFPSRPWNFAPTVSLPGPHHGIRRLVRVGKRQAPVPIRDATSAVCSCPGLHLNAFRGEPAISGFAWHFTPTHRSSLPFAMDMGSGLHARVPRASPCPWVAHPVSGHLDATTRPFGLGFPPAPAVAALTSPRQSTRRLILQKARRHSLVSQQAPTGWRHTVSGSVSLPLAGCFSPFPHGTGSLSVAGRI